MNVMIEYIIQVDFQGFITSSQVALPLVRAFMDDLNLMAIEVEQTNVLLKRACVALAWARMEFRAKKSRGLVIRDGNITKETPFFVQHEGSLGEYVQKMIPSVHSMPIRFLGRIVDASLSDTQQAIKLREKVESCLILIDKSRHFGINKVWILQFLLLSALRWLLMIYEISISFTYSLEQKISKYIRNWMGLHRTLSPIALYSKQSPCPLPISSLVGIEITAKAGALLKLRDSADVCVSSNVPMLYAGRVWSPADSVKDAESILYFRELRGNPATGRLGLGYIPCIPFPEKDTKEHRKIVCDTVFEEHDKRLLLDTYDRYNKASPEGQPHQSLQLHWMSWCDYIRNDFSWKAIWAMGPDLLRFAIQSTFNTMSCPKNQVCWKESPDASCQLCSRSPHTIPHILSNCPFSLDTGRYTFRHDCVVKILVKAISDQLHKKNMEKPTPKEIKFVRKGELKPKATKKPILGILDKAKDWILHCDLGGNQSTVPPCLAITTERPGIALYPPSIRHAIFIEKTSGCEENFQYNHTRKKIGYDILVNMTENNGWTTFLFCVEVGARGYCSESVSSCLAKLGFQPKFKRETLKSLGLTAMKASFALWLSRADKSKIF